MDEVTLNFTEFRPAFRPSAFSSSDVGNSDFTKFLFVFPLWPARPEENAIGAGGLGTRRTNVGSRRLTLSGISRLVSISSIQFTGRRKRKVRRNEKCGG